MSKSSLTMIGYGLFLVAGALVAISISGWDRSKTALFSSGGAAAIMIAVALLANSKAHKLKMIGIHVGLVLPLVFGATFFWRLTLNWAKPTEAEWLAANPSLAVDTAKIESPLQNWLFPTFIAGSTIAFILILLTRPKKADREAEAA